VYCIYASGIPTPDSYEFDAPLPNGNLSQVHFDDGDQIVSSVSASYCKRWQGRQKQNVTTLAFRDLSHTGILSSQLFMDYVHQQIFGGGDDE